MIFPYKPEELFETPRKVDVFSFENDVLIVDNWYKNYEDIKKILTNIPVPKWKCGEGSRNFIDYLDCRTVLPVNFPDESTSDNLKIYGDLIRQFYGFPEVYLQNYVYEFNYFKHIKEDVSRDLQHHPHVDYVINCIVYMDEVSSGGTAVYETDQAIENNEHINILYDVSGLKKTVIEAKPNRMVMLRGTKYHGGYIEDHNKYINDWRINQVMFFQNP